MSLRGVNLGGWLVLEKWITPSLFNGLTAVDEYTFCHETGSNKFELLENHRSKLIGEKDFAWLAKNGVQIIRLPIGYWALHNFEPFVSCTKYIDNAFGWAEKYGIKILLDVHAAPGSQNGNDHSGRAGQVNWAESANVQATLNFIKKIAIKYGHQKSLWGISLLNEPSNKISRQVLENFYLDGYKIARDYCHENCAVVISDYFDPLAWKDFMSGNEYINVLLDLHFYQVFGKDKKLSLDQHLKKTRKDWTKIISSINRPAIIGEWSLGLDPSTFKNMTAEEKQSALKPYANAQLAVFDSTDAWFFWTYKTETMPEWSFRDCLESGLINFNQ